jgi:hypothetical protein
VRCRRSRTAPSTTEQSSRRSWTHDRSRTVSATRLVRGSRPPLSASGRRTSARRWTHDGSARDRDRRQMRSSATPPAPRDQRCAPSPLQRRGSCAVVGECEGAVRAPRLDRSALSRVTEWRAFDHAPPDSRDSDGDPAGVRRDRDVAFAQVRRPQARRRKRRFGRRRGETRPWPSRPSASGGPQRESTRSGDANSGVPRTRPLANRGRIASVRHVRTRVRAAIGGMPATRSHHVR